MSASYLPPLGPDDEVTHYGRTEDPGAGFKCQPDPAGGEDSLSLIEGRLPVAEATSLVCRLRYELTGMRKGDAVRYSTVGRLSEAGFVVERTPLPWNDRHLSVQYPGVWDDDVCRRFHACFEALAVWGDEQ